MSFKSVLSLSLSLSPWMLGTSRMKLLNYSWMFIKNFNTNASHNITPYVKFSIFQHKHKVLHKTKLNFPLILSIHRLLRIGYLSEIGPLNRHSEKNGKLFRERENEFAHHIMEKMPQYSCSLVKTPLSIDISSELDQTFVYSNVILEFEKATLLSLSENLTLENPKFTDLVSKVCSSLPTISDEDVKKLLHCLCIWPPPSSTRVPNFKILWNMLDEECVKRMHRWNVTQKFLIADYWFHLKLSRISQYNPALISNLIKNIDSLSHHQVIQLMFYITLQRKIPGQFLRKLEEKLESIIKFLTPDELTIICLGYFKTQSKTSSVNLIKSINKTFMDNLENFHTVSVAAILKFLRISMDHSLINSYILTLHKCISFIDKFDIPTSVHLALFSSQCNVYHPLLLNCVSEKVGKEIADVRIKDCSKLLMCLSTYNHYEEKFRDLFFAELNKEDRQDEIRNFPLHILHSVLSYAYMGYYNYGIIAKIFEKEFVKNSLLLSPELESTYATLDGCIEVECPDYTGPRLDITQRNILRSRRGNLPSKSQFENNMQTRLIGEVYESLVEILGNDKNVLIRHILPHFYAPDIIVRLSGSTNKSLSDLCQEFSTDFILRPPSDEKWAVFVMLAIYSFAHKSTQMTGVNLMKIRQLEKIGYHVISVPYFNVSRKMYQRNTFLKEKLNMLEEKCEIIASKR